MQKLKVLIVEDTPSDAQLVKTLIEGDKEGIAESFTIAESYEEALDALSSGTDFDLSILDVKLADHTSFELVKRFAKQRFGIIAFMTENDIPSHISRLAQPMLQIEKPFDREQIANFISEVKKLRKLSLTDLLPATIQTQSVPGKFGILQKNGDSIVVDCARICAVKSDNKSTEFYVADPNGKTCQMINSAESLNSVLSRLPTSNFMRCFKSWVVNSDFVQNIRPDGDHGGGIYTGLKGCDRVPYSDHFKDQIYAKINARRL